MIESGKFLQQRYRIDRQIGQGGMGAVYVATDERFGSTVAIKETLCMDENFRKAIEREARLLNSLKHSALPRVSDHFEEDNGQFLVMEFIDGDDLATIIERGHAGFALADVLKWADQLLDALEYLHNQSIPVIHRDIKPQNLKVTPRGDIILLDFGLAKGNPTDAGHQTAAKSIFGYSRNYASLEQIQGTGTDPRSDLYSLAATLYHLMTGHAPEDALTRAMAVLSQKDDPLVPANHIQPKIPAGVAGVMQNALDLNASERPASAADMRQMLRESEKYTAFADTTVAVNKVAGTNLLAQQTKLMGDETAAGVSQREVKTEVFKPNASELTAFRAVTTNAPQNRRGLAIAAAALAFLIGGSAVAGGIYVMNPSIFGTDEPESADTPETTANETTTANSNVPAADNSSSETINTQTPGSTQLTETTKSQIQTQDGKTRPVDGPKDSEPTETEMETITDDDGTVVQLPKDGKGNIIVTRKNPDGSTTTTTVEQGKFPTTMRKPPNEMPPGVDLRNLTPEQRRRLRNVMRKGQMDHPVPVQRPAANKPRY